MRKIYIKIRQRKDLAVVANICNKSESFLRKELYEFSVTISYKPLSYYRDITNDESIDALKKLYQNGFLTNAFFDVSDLVSDLTLLKSFVKYCCILKLELKPDLKHSEDQLKDFTDKVQKFNPEVKIEWDHRARLSKFKKYNMNRYGR